MERFVCIPFTGQAAADAEAKVDVGAKADAGAGVPCDAARAAWVLHGAHVPACNNGSGDTAGCFYNTSYVRGAGGRGVLCGGRAGGDAAHRPALPALPAGPGTAPGNRPEETFSYRLILRPLTMIIYKIKGEMFSGYRIFISPGHNTSQHKFLTGQRRQRKVDRNSSAHIRLRYGHHYRRRGVAIAVMRAAVVTARWQRPVIAVMAVAGTIIAVSMPRALVIAMPVSALLPSLLLIVTFIMSVSAALSFGRIAEKKTEDHNQYECQH